MTMKNHFQQRGVAAVEFAILLPLLLLIVFGITEFGRALYYYNTIVKATRDAARYYAAQQPGMPPLKEAEIKNLAVYGNTAGTGSPLAPNLATGMVTLCDWMSCPATNKVTTPAVNLVTVTITGYTFQYFVPFFTADLSSIVFDDISTTMEGNL
jgi:Flp pilus assembly protein TadG